MPEPRCDPIAPNNVDVTFAIIKVRFRLGTRFAGLAPHTSLAPSQPDAREKAPEVVKAIEAAGFKVAHSRVLTMTVRAPLSFAA